MSKIDLKDIEEIIFKELKSFNKAQTGWCACLGHCEKCGHHLCHGCYCDLSVQIKDKIIRYLKEHDTN